MLHMGVEYSIFKILKKAGERRPAPAPPRLQLNDCGKLFEYVVHSSPQLGISPFEARRSRPGTTP